MSLQPVTISEATPASFREFCAAAATVMAEQVFERAADHDTNLSTKMEAAKWFAKMADYEPKTNVVANAGSGFQLVINFSGAPQEQMGTVIDVAPSAPLLLDAPPAHVTLRPPRNAQFLSDEPDPTDLYAAEVG